MKWRLEIGHHYPNFTEAQPGYLVPPGDSEVELRGRAGPLSSVKDLRI